MCTSSPKKPDAVQPVIPQAAPTALASPYDDSSVGLAALRIAGQNGLRARPGSAAGVAASALTINGQVPSPVATVAPVDAPSSAATSAAAAPASTIASRNAYKSGYVA